MFVSIQEHVHHGLLFFARVHVYHTCIAKLGVCNTAYCNTGILRLECYETVAVVLRRGRDDDGSAKNGFLPGGAKHLGCRKTPSRHQLVAINHAYFWKAGIQS